MLLIIVKYFVSFLLVLQPSPLFTKIETSVTDELKKRFAGKQKSPPPQSSATKVVPPVQGGPKSDVVNALQAAVDKQVSNWFTGTGEIYYFLHLCSLLCSIVDVTFSF